MTDLELEPVAKVIFNFYIIMMRKLNHLDRKGITLIEILMAVLVTVILAVIGISQFSNFSADAKNAATKTNLALLRNAIGVKNALERVRCSKTSILFPNVATISNNDITGCTVIGQAGVGSATAPCNPTILVNPSTGAAYGATCAAAYAGAYLSLISLIDQPYVQTSIPNNPWTGAISTAAPNLITKDTSPAVAATSCLNAPVDTYGAFAIATQCGLVSVAMTSTSLTLEAGWCYCQETGQIWANSANNDGLAAGTGNESNF